MPARTIAVGDIHGCSLALDTLLDAIRPRPEDTVVTLGDCINRGPDTRGVIERLIHLGRRCRLVSLLCNHEEMLFEALAGSYPLGYFLGVGGDPTISDAKSSWAMPGRQPEPEYAERRRKPSMVNGQPSSPATGDHFLPARRKDTSYQLSVRKSRVAKRNRPPKRADSSLVPATDPPDRR
jgi:hypothetical protein